MEEDAEEIDDEREEREDDEAEDEEGEKVDGVASACKVVGKEGVIGRLN